MSSLDEDDTLVRYGATIRLNAVSQYVKQKGGYVGYFKKTRKVGHHSPGPYVAIPPFDASNKHLFTPSCFKVVDPRGEKKDGEPLLYDEEVMLVDDEGMVWNNSMGPISYIGAKPRGSIGHMNLKLVQAERPHGLDALLLEAAAADDDDAGPAGNSSSNPNNGTHHADRDGSAGGVKKNGAAGSANNKDATRGSSSGGGGVLAGGGDGSAGGLPRRPVRYGDFDVKLDVVNVNRKLLRRKYSNFVTNFKHDGSKHFANMDFGGYLVCDGRGLAMTFSVHHAPPMIAKLTLYRPLPKDALPHSAAAPPFSPLGGEGAMSPQQQQQQQLDGSGAGERARGESLMAKTGLNPAQALLLENQAVQIHYDVAWHSKIQFHLDRYVDPLVLLQERQRMQEEHGKQQQEEDTPHTRVMRAFTAVTSSSSSSSSSSPLPPPLTPSSPPPPPPLSPLPPPLEEEKATPLPPAPASAGVGSRDSSNKSSSSTSGGGVPTTGGADAHSSSQNFSLPLPLSPPPASAGPSPLPTSPSSAVAVAVAGGGSGSGSGAPPAAPPPLPPRDPVVRVILSNGGRVTVYRDEIEHHLQQAAKKQRANLAAAAADGSAGGGSGGGLDLRGSTSAGAPGFWVDLMDREEEEQAHLDSLNAGAGGGGGSAGAAAAAGVGNGSSKGKRLLGHKALGFNLKLEKGAIQLRFERLADDEGNDEREGGMGLSAAASPGGTAAGGLALTASSSSSLAGQGLGRGSSLGSPSSPASFSTASSSSFSSSSSSFRAPPPPLWSFEGLRLLASDLCVVATPWALRCCFVASVFRVAYLVGGVFLLPNSSPSGWVSNFRTTSELAHIRRLLVDTLNQNRPPAPSLVPLDDDAWPLRALLFGPLSAALEWARALALAPLRVACVGAAVVLHEVASFLSDPTAVDVIAPSATLLLASVYAARFLGIPLVHPVKRLLRRKVGGPLRRALARSSSSSSSANGRKGGEEELDGYEEDDEFDSLEDDDEFDGKESRGGDEGDEFGAGLAFGTRGGSAAARRRATLVSGGGGGSSVQHTRTADGRRAMSLWSSSSNSSSSGGGVLLSDLSSGGSRGSGGGCAVGGDGSVAVATGEVERWKVTLLQWDFQPADMLNKKANAAGKKKKKQQKRRTQRSKPAGTPQGEGGGDDGYEEDDEGKGNGEDSSEDEEEGDEDDDDDEEEEPFVLPERFLMAENGDYEKGLQRWKDTCAWRVLKDADHTLDRAHPRMCLIKECYPHFFHGRDKQGNVVYYELPGMVNYARMKAAGIDKDVFVDHVMYVQEYLWTVIQPAQEDRVVLVLDLAGLGMGTVTNKEIVSIIKGCVAMTSTHYPARSHKMIVANVPAWFGIAFNIVKPLLNEAQRAKINIFRAHEVLEGMRGIIPDDQIPREYGGSSAVPLGHDEMEQGLRRQVFSNLASLEVPLSVDGDMVNPDGTPATLENYVYSPRSPT